ASPGTDPGRRVSRLPTGDQRLRITALVSRPAPDPDRRGVVVEPPPAAHSSKLRATRRSTMTTRTSITTIAFAGIGALALLLAAHLRAAQLLAAHAGQALKVDFSDDTVGSEPKSFLSVVGVWRIEAEGNNKVLAVDGRQWKEGQTAAGGADKARALYGERYAQVLDRVPAYPYFPYAVAKDGEDFRNGEITVRFEGISGRIDQGAGILFNLKTNGDYLTLRANPLENNLVLWKFENGKRTSVKWIRNTPTPTR